MEQIRNERVIELAHRIAWRYKKSSDPNHSDTYTFNESTLLQFAARIQEEFTDSVPLITNNSQSLF